MNGIRVLMAEDELLAADVLEEALLEAGFAMLRAADGQAALELAEGHGFDVLLTDLRMPRMDGRELIQRLRRRFPNLPVVVMTGYDPGGNDVAALTGDGPLRLLAKPLLLSDVVTAVLDVAGDRMAARG